MRFLGIFSIFLRGDGVCFFALKSYFLDQSSKYKIMILCMRKVIFMKTTPFCHKNILRRKVKVTCSPERQIIEDQFNNEDLMKEAEIRFLAAQLIAEKKERIARLIREAEDAANNIS